VSPTVRTHRILWTGWAETARFQAACGLRMNLDYYHVGSTFQSRAGEWVCGHFTGSGLPMKFVDGEGRVLNIYQQLTQLVDEHLLAMPWMSHGVPGLAPKDAVEVSRTLLRRSLNGAWSAIAAQFHVDPYAMGGETSAQAVQWLEGTLDYAAEQGVPIWSAAEWLRFTEVRHDADLEGVAWRSAARRLSFKLASRLTPDVELTVMVPLWHGEAKLAQVEVNGQPVQHGQRIVGGVSYGWVSIPAGSHQVEATYGSTLSG